jgi:hypothetical protein
VFTYTESGNAIGHPWIFVHSGERDNPGQAEGSDELRRLTAGRACLLIRGLHLLGGDERQGVEVSTVVHDRG